MSPAERARLAFAVDASDKASQDMYRAAGAWFGSPINSTDAATQLRVAALREAHEQARATEHKALCALRALVVELLRGRRA